jgi:hypothetical protein
MKEPKEIKWYLAGPMTGIPQFNYPLFDQVAGELRLAGFDITSPAEMDNEDTREEALASPTGIHPGGITNGETWGDFLARDVKLIADELEGVILLPDWQKSRGARLEVFVAINCKHPVYAYEGTQMVKQNYARLLDMISLATLSKW